MNDPQIDLSMLKYLRRHSMSLRGHYEVTSGLIQNAPIELKFDMNDPFGILHIQNYSRGHSKSDGHEVTSSVTTHSHLSSESRCRY